MMMTQLDIFAANEENMVTRKDTLKCSNLPSKHIQIIDEDRNPSNKQRDDKLTKHERSNTQL